MLLLLVVVVLVQARYCWATLLAGGSTHAAGVLNTAVYLHVDGSLTSDSWLSEPHCNSTCMDQTQGRGGDTAPTHTESRLLTVSERDGPFQHDWPPLNSISV